MAAEGSRTAGTAIEKWTKYPPREMYRRGFLASWSKRIALEEGTVISRYGDGFGRFASPEGTPFNSRGLPPEVAAEGETLYVVKKPFDVDAGLAGDWMGGGGGIQYDLPVTIDVLVWLKYLEPVP